MAAGHRLPLANRLVYASGSIAGNSISRTKDLWLFFFYGASDSDGDVSRKIALPVLAAIIFATRIIEAVDDPLIGYWSDRTNTRWGRRIPFVVLSTPFYVLFFFLLWLPPYNYESIANAVYLFIMLEAFHLFSTLSGGPFESLLPEIAPDNESRVFIVTWQVLFGTVGSAFALLGSGLIIDAFGYPAMAAIIMVMALVSRYVALAGAWRYTRRDVGPAQLKVWEAFRSTFTNSQFVYFLPSFVLFNMGVTLMTSALPFFVDEVLKGNKLNLDLGFGQFTVKEEGLTSVLTATAIAVVLISLPFVYRLAVTRGKAWVYSHAMLLGAMILPWMFFMGFVPSINKIPQVFLFIALVGLPMSSVFTFPNALIADIIDYDELKTGMRREAMYYGTQATIEKWASALYAPILAGLLLIGSTTEDPLGIRLVGPVAGCAVFLGYLVFRGYKLPDTVNADTVKIT